MSFPSSLLTIIEVAHFYHAWAHTHEQYAILLVLRVELCDDRVQGCLGSSVQRAIFNFEIVDEVQIGVTA